MRGHFGDEKAGVRNGAKRVVICKGRRSRPDSQARATRSDPLAAMCFIHLVILTCFPFASVPCPPACLQVSGREAGRPATWRFQGAPSA